MLLSEEVDVARVNRRIREMLVQQSLEAAVRSVGPPRGRWMIAAMGIAAAFMLFVAGYLLTPSQVSQVYADAAEDHQGEVIRAFAATLAFRSDPDRSSGAQSRALAWPSPVNSLPATILRAEKSAGSMTASIFIWSIATARSEFSLFLRARDAENLDARSSRVLEWPPAARVRLRKRASRVVLYPALKCHRRHG